MAGNGNRNIVKDNDMVRDRGAIRNRGMVKDKGIVQNREMARDRDVLRAIDTLRVWVLLRVEPGSIVGRDYSQEGRGRINVRVNVLRTQVHDALTRTTINNPQKRPSLTHAY